MIDQPVEITQHRKLRLAKKNVENVDKAFIFFSLTILSLALHALFESQLLITIAFYATIGFGICTTIYFHSVRSHAVAEVKEIEKEIPQ